MKSSIAIKRSFAKTDYRFLLFNEFEQRRQKNSRYSIRGFAQALDLSAAYLSLVFSEKRDLTRKTAVEILEKLKWPKQRKKLFLALLDYERAPSKQIKETILSEIDSWSELNFLELNQDQFQYLSEPYHFAIVELSEMTGFRNDPTWIAKRLGITKAEVTEAIGRLLRMSILKIKNSKLSKDKTHYRIRDAPSEAIRNFHKSNLKAAQLALEQQSFDRRDFSGTSVAIDLKNLPEIKELIRDFRGKLSRYCANVTDKDAVYQLSVQFFRLDKEQDS